MAVHTHSPRLVEHLVSEMNHPTEATPLRMKCLSCPRQLNPADMIVGYCPYCMEERAKNMVEKFRPFDSAKQKFPTCQECKGAIYTYGRIMWETGAKSFKLVCTSCCDKQAEKDEQYINTPWGRERGYK